MPIVEDNHKILLNLMF